MNKIDLPCNLGSAQLDRHAESKALADKSDTLNVAHSGYLVMQIVNLEKIQAVNRQNQLGLVAIDKAHEWDFRQMYKRCEELHVLLLNAPIMALSVTVTVQVEEPQMP